MFTTHGIAMIGAGIAAFVLHVLYEVDRHAWLSYSWRFAMSMVGTFFSSVLLLFPACIGVFVVGDEHLSTFLAVSIGCALFVYGYAAVISLWIVVRGNFASTQTSVEAYMRDAVRVPPKRAQAGSSIPDSRVLFFTFFLGCIVCGLSLSCALFFPISFAWADITSYVLFLCISSACMAGVCAPLWFRVRAQDAGLRTAVGQITPYEFFAVRGLLLALVCEWMYMFWVSPELDIVFLCCIVAIGGYVVFPLVPRIYTGYTVPSLVNATEVTAVERSHVNILVVASVVLLILYTLEATWFEGAGALFLVLMRYFSFYARILPRVQASTQKDSTLYPRWIWATCATLCVTVCALVLYAYGVSASALALWTLCVMSVFRLSTPLFVRKIID